VLQNKEQSEAVAQAGVDVCVALELAEEGAGVVAEEDIGAHLPGQVVVDPDLSIWVVLVGPAQHQPLLL